ncbi:TLD-domain-containing protein [Xylariaceae sp. FL0016]|nr:TLD-domain-containing protein [Xylariaceae sp. FL0016]
MSGHDSGNLIDLDDSAPTSGTTSPFQVVQHPPPQPHHDHSFQESYSDLSSPPRKRQSPSGSSPPHLTHSASSASGYGLGSAVWGLWRRISTLDGSVPSQAPTPPPGTSQLYHANTTPYGPGDGINGAFTPPRRAASPRGLMPLEPLTLSGYAGDTPTSERLLERGIAEEIRTFLPERLKIMENWQLVYSLYQHGSSLGTLYQLCEEYRGRRAGFVLVVRDGKDGTFGAYLTEAPHPAASYYGTGECFLWRASLHAPLPPPPSADTTDLNFRTTTIASPTTSTFAQNPLPMDHLAPLPTDPTTNKLAPASSAASSAPIPAHSIRFQNFAYSGANDYCVFCEAKFLSVGGGQGGKFGLWLDDELSRGHSAECDTFLNQPLSDEGEKFDVLGVELWAVGVS